MHVAFLAPDTVAENLLEPHPHTNNTHPHFSYQPTFAYARLRTARKTDNSMQMAEGGFGTKINNAYAFRKTRLRENLTPPLRSAIMCLRVKLDTVFYHTIFLEHHKTQVSVN